MQGRKSPAVCLRLFSATPLSAGDQAPPIADAGPDLVVQPGSSVLLNGIESVPLGGAHITDYRWTLLKGNSSVSMEVRWAEPEPGAVSPVSVCTCQ